VLCVSKARRVAVSTGDGLLASKAIDDSRHRAGTVNVSNNLPLTVHVLTISYVRGSGFTVLVVGLMVQLTLRCHVVLCRCPC
jgi:hypothetical protein